MLKKAQYKGEKEKGSATKNLNNHLSSRDDEQVMVDDEVMMIKDVT